MSNYEYPTTHVSDGKYNFGELETGDTKRFENHPYDWMCSCNHCSMTRQYSKTDESEGE